MSEVFAVAAQLEREIGELYAAFAEAIPEERDFWLRISGDEDEHADWIDSFTDLMDAGQAAPGLLRPDERELRDSLDMVKHLQHHVANHEIDMEWAVETALELEAGHLEKRYARLVTGASDAVHELLQRLLAAQQIHSNMLETKASEVRA